MITRRWGAYMNKGLQLHIYKTIRDETHIYIVRFFIISTLIKIFQNTCHVSIDFFRFIRC